MLAEIAKVDAREKELVARSITYRILLNRGVEILLPEDASAQDQHGHRDPSTTATRPSISSGSSGTNSSNASAMISSGSLIALEIVD